MVLFISLKEPDVCCTIYSICIWRLNLASPPVEHDTDWELGRIWPHSVRLSKTFIFERFLNYLLQSKLNGMKMLDLLGNICTKSQSYVYLFLDLASISKGKTLRSFTARISAFVSGRKEGERMFWQFSVIWHEGQNKNVHFFLSVRGRYR